MGMVEVSHEALIRHWKRLKIWLEEEREGKRIHDQLRTVAQEWERNGCNKDYLYKGSVLTTVLDWQEVTQCALNSSEESFLQQCIQQKNKSAIMKYSYIAVLLLLIVANLSLIIIQQGNRREIHNAQQLLQRKTAKEKKELEKIKNEISQEHEKTALLKKNLEKERMAIQEDRNRLKESERIIADKKNEISQKHAIVALLGRDLARVSLSLPRRPVKESERSTEKMSMFRRLCSLFCVCPTSSKPTSQPTSKTK
jgi:uncharacterized membrane-anchored protein YhcB (DUF1043 family)